MLDIFKLDRSEFWRFDLPSLVLRGRRLVPAEMVERLGAEGADFDGNGFIDARSTLLWVQMSEGALSGVVKDHESQTLRIQMPHSRGEIPLQLEKSDSWIAVLSRSREGVMLRLWARDQRISTLRGQIKLKSARAARFRLDEATLVVGDDQGRLIVFDLNTGDVLGNHRLF